MLERLGAWHRVRDRRTSSGSSTLLQREGKTRASTKPGRLNAPFNGFCDDRLSSVTSPRRPNAADKVVREAEMELGGIWAAGESWTEFELDIALERDLLQRAS